jgi:uncharacterized tellurite resistance protein B-like protein
MLTRIRQFFERELEPGVRQGDEHALRLATAALLFEMTRQDDTVTDDERAAVTAAVRDRFGLSTGEAETLTDLAEEEAHGATDYYQFTSLINQHFDHSQKIRMVESLWRVAAADGHVHHYEEHLVRRIAELLYVSHGEFIAAKHRAMNQM